MKKPFENRDACIVRIYPCCEWVPVGVEADEFDLIVARWVDAGGTVFDGRMVALRDSSIWRLPLIDDGFNAGMRFRDIARDDARQLGMLLPEMDATLASDELQRAIRGSGIAKVGPDGRFIPN